MSRIVLVSLALWCAACGSAVPVVSEAAPPDHPPVPEVAAPVVELSPIEPPPPPPLVAAPAGSLTARHEYPRIGVTEWTLANGMTVVHKRMEDGTASFVSVASPAGSVASLPIVDSRESPGDGAAGAWDGWSDGTSVAVWATLDGSDVMAPLTLVRRLVSGEGGSGETILDADVRTITVLLVGPWPAEEVESAVGHGLARIRPAARPTSGARSATPAAGSSIDLRAPFRWTDVPALLVLATGLDARPGVTARVGLDPRGGGLSLRVMGTGNLGAVLRPLEADELAAARRQALDLWGPDAVEGWGRLLQALWAEQGEFRPARDPAVVGRILADIVRVSPASVEALFTALRASAPSAPSR